MESDLPEDSDSISVLEEVDGDSAVVECATPALLEQILPLLRVSAKLSEFRMSAAEADVLCLALHNRNFLDTPPSLLGADLADAVMNIPVSHGFTEGACERFAGRLRAVPAADAFLLFAGTALYWAVRTNHANANPRDFLRVEG